MIAINKKKYLMNIFLFLYVSQQYVLASASKGDKYNMNHNVQFDKNFFQDVKEIFWGNANDTEYMNNLKKKIEIFFNSIDPNDENTKIKIKKFFNVILDGINQGFFAGMRQNAAIELKNFFDDASKNFEETIKQGGSADAAMKQFLERLNSYLDKGIHRNLNKISNIVIYTFGGIFTFYYGLPFCFKILERWLSKPKLIIEYYKKGFFGSLFQSTKNIQHKTMIFNQQLQVRLDNLISITKIINKKIKTNQKNATYRNLLLYGPPGTGKTMFAKELARRSGMEYAYLSGSSFAKFKDGEGIEALDELMQWAEKSNGLLIFIDEAETFLYNREKMDPQSKSYLLLNNFLNYTGSRSNKFMLVFATNHKDILDSAMYRRIDDLVCVKLPGNEERIKLLKLYIKNLLLDEKTNEISLVNSAKKLLKNKKIEEISLAIKGLSGGEIESLITCLRTNAEIEEPTQLTLDLIDSTVKDAVEKYMEFTQGRYLNLVED
jgi:hypothetical protein